MINYPHPFHLSPLYFCIVAINIIVAVKGVVCIAPPLIAVPIECRYLYC